eukprot:7382024-Prymnesium_polylepis.1
MASAKSDWGSTEVTYAPSASMRAVNHPLFAPRSTARHGRVPQPERNEMITSRTCRSITRSPREPDTPRQTLLSK